MKTTDLYDQQVIVLTQDVRNPNPDRRKTRAWGSQPVWKTGTRFLVREYDPLANLPVASTPVMTLEPQVRNGILYSLYPQGGNTGAYDLVVQAAEPAEPTLDTVLQQAMATDWGYEHVLRVLLKQGKVTLDDVRSALDVEVDFPVAC